MQAHGRSCCLNIQSAVEQTTGKIVETKL